MIIWDKITKIFNTDILTRSVKALDDVSFELKPGSMTGFIGANGAGKTTSLKIALGFTSPTSGRISFSKELGENRQSALKRTGFLPERPYFYPHLTGEEFSTYMGLLSGMDKIKIVQQRKLLSERLKIDHALNRPLKTYSKGMLQRLGFLVAIQHDPELVILDEPLSGLDPVGRKELKDLMSDIHRNGKTVFFSTHIVSDVEETCDQLVCLKHGKLIYSGGVRELLDKSKESFCRIAVDLDPMPSFATPIRSVKKQSLLWVIEVELAHQEELIMELIKAKGKILSISSERTSLEDIFYGAGK